MFPGFSTHRRQARATRLGLCARDILVHDGSALLNFDHNRQLPRLHWPHAGQEYQRAAMLRPVSASHVTLEKTIREYVARRARLGEQVSARETSRTQS